MLAMPAVQSSNLHAGEVVYIEQSRDYSTKLNEFLNANVDLSFWLSFLYFLLRFI